MATVTIEGRFAMTTPLFCGGADPARAELRIPSFKGVLRFWWRALAWSRCDGDLGKIRECEDRLFGSSTTGQSRVLIHLLPSQFAPRTLDAGKILTLYRGSVVGHGVRYFGYGLMEAYRSRMRNTQDGQLTRSCLLPPFEFTVMLRGADLTDDERKSLQDALIALGTMGGLGARNRRGYGSLVLEELRLDGRTTWTAPLTMTDLSKCILQLYNSHANTSLPEYTALSKKTRHVLLSADKVEPLELLDRVGREMVRYRSWGRGGKILGEATIRKDGSVMTMT